MATKEITLGEFFDNIEKNGLPQAYSILFRKADPNSSGDTIDLLQFEIFETDSWTYNGPVKIVEACALGQGYLNSGITTFSESYKCSRWYEDDGTPTEAGTDYMFLMIVEDFIANLNDVKKLPIAKIADAARSKYADFLDRKFVVKTFDWGPWL